MSCGSNPHFLLYQVVQKDYTTQETRWIPELDEHRRGQPSTIKSVDFVKDLFVAKISKGSGEALKRGAHAGGYDTGTRPPWSLDAPARQNIFRGSASPSTGKVKSNKWCSKMSCGSSPHFLLYQVAQKGDTTQEARWIPDLDQHRCDLSTQYNKKWGFRKKPFCCQDLKGKWCLL